MLVENTADFGTLYPGIFLGKILRDLLIFLPKLSLKLTKWEKNFIAKCNLATYDFFKKFFILMKMHNFSTVLAELIFSNFYHSEPESSLLI